MVIEQVLGICVVVELYESIFISGWDLISWFHMSVYYKIEYDIIKNG